ncbi:YbdD/YjiX family protein [Nocardia cyriacigeorgica]|nr:YbdD/YjiX family protein [Nocardia cyriacigeorgica]
MGRTDREGRREGTGRGTREGALTVDAAVTGRAGTSSDRTVPRVTEQGRIGPARGRGRAVLGAVRGVLWYFDSVLGGQDYQRYVAHLRRQHPDCPIPSEREYWRERHAEADRNPANRCC